MMRFRFTLSSGAEPGDAKPRITRISPTRAKNHPDGTRRSISSYQNKKFKPIVIIAAITASVAGLAYQATPSSKTSCFVKP